MTKIETAVGTFTNDQWNFDRRGPNHAIQLAEKHGILEAQNTFWQDHLDTNKLGPREWEYIAEPYGTIEETKEHYADQFEFLRSVGWDIEFQGKEASVWHAIHGTGTIHISLVKSSEERLQELEEKYKAQLEVLKAEAKTYGRYVIKEGTDRSLIQVQVEREWTKMLIKLVRKP